jgi:hypothetical protein
VGTAIGVGDGVDEVGVLGAGEDVEPPSVGRPPASSLPPQAVSDTVRTAASSPEATRERVKTVSSQ